MPRREGMAVRLGDERMDVGPCAANEALKRRAEDLSRQIGDGDENEWPATPLGDGEHSRDRQPDRSFGAGIAEPAKGGIERSDSVGDDPGFGVAIPGQHRDSRAGV